MCSSWMNNGFVYDCIQCTCNFLFKSKWVLPLLYQSTCNAPKKVLMDILCLKLKQSGVVYQSNAILFILFLKLPLWWILGRRKLKKKFKSKLMHPFEKSNQSIKKLIYLPVYESILSEQACVTIIKINWSKIP